MEVWKTTVCDFFKRRLGSRMIHQITSRRVSTLNTLCTVVWDSLHGYLMYPAICDSLHGYQMYPGHLWLTAWLSDLSWPFVTHCTAIWCILVIFDSVHGYLMYPGHLRLNAGLFYPGHICSSFDLPTVTDSLVIAALCFSQDSSAVSRLTSWAWHWDDCWRPAWPWCPSPRRWTAWCGSRPHRATPPRRCTSCSALK